MQFHLRVKIPKSLVKLRQADLEQLLRATREHARSQGLYFHAGLMVNGAEYQIDVQYDEKLRETMPRIYSYVQVWRNLPGAVML